MRITVENIDPTVPSVDHSGRFTFQVRTVLLQLIQQSGLIIGTGSPSGVVEAQQGKFYMDDTGTAGNILYIKRNADVGGNKKLGWILV
jgi:hypothetical protein